MNLYLFKTTATMKPYNNKHWWIDPSIINDCDILANNINEAISKYRDLILEKHYVNISDNALKHKNPMFIDRNDETKQVGYVFTAKTDFEDRDNYKYTSQYIELWVTILTIIDTDFEEAN